MIEISVKCISKYKTWSCIYETTEVCNVIAQHVIGFGAKK